MLVLIKMPWSVEDVDRHKKGLTAKQKRQWVGVANSSLKKHGNDARAIREANAAVGKPRAKSRLYGR